VENTITKYEPRVSVCLFDLTQWFLERTNRFPKNWRVTLGDRIDALLIEMMSKIQRATIRKDKLGLLESVNEDLDVLRVLSRLCVNLGCLEGRQREYVAKQIDEIGRQIGGWIKQQRRS
jgi:hypothetical protein